MGALEADFQRVYGIDLADVFSGRIGVVRAANLALHLPRGSAVHEALGLDESWTPGEHLLALLADQIAAGNWQRGGGKGKRPKPLLRPSDVKAEAERSERERVKALRYRRRRRQEVANGAGVHPGGAGSNPRVARRAEHGGGSDPEST